MVQLFCLREAKSSIKFQCENEELDMMEYCYNYRVVARLSSSGKFILVKKFEHVKGYAKVEKSFLFWKWITEEEYVIEDAEDKCIEFAKKIWKENKGEFQEIIAKCSYGDGYSYGDIILWENGKFPVGYHYNV